MPKSVSQCDPAAPLVGNDLFYVAQLAQTVVDRKLTWTALLSQIRGLHVENFPISAGGGGDLLELTTNAPLSIIRCTGGGAYPIASSVTLSDMASIPAGGQVLLVNQTANYLTLGISAVPPVQDRTLGCGPGNAMLVFKDLNNTLRAYSFDDVAWRQQLLAPVTLSLASVFADSIHSPGVIQAVSTLVAAESYIKIRPVDHVFSRFEVSMDLKFNADASRGNYPASFRFGQNTFTSKWAKALLNMADTSSGVSNGHVATQTQPSPITASFFDDPAHAGNYGIAISTKTWTDLLSSVGAGRMFGTFRIGA